MVRQETKAISKQTNWLVEKNAVKRFLKLIRWPKMQSNLLGVKCTIKMEIYNNSIFLLIIILPYDYQSSTKYLTYLGEI